MSAVVVAKRIVRSLIGRTVKHPSDFIAAVKGKRGIEIGGPSPAFSDSGMLPIYRHIRSLDNCNFSESTVWDGKKRTVAGFNFIREGTDLHGIPDEEYDFVLSCHSLEHIANPIKALREWKRVLKPEGSLILVLPDYRKTFDHNRTVTPLSHLIDDFRNDVGEDDRTHIDEVKFGDFATGTYQEHIDRVERNLELRCVHHHVFDQANSREMLGWAGYRVHTVELVSPFNIILLGHLPSASPSARLDEGAVDRTAD